jgi:hypothetical protein
LNSSRCLMVGPFSWLCSILLAFSFDPSFRWWSKYYSSWHNNLNVEDQQYNNFPMDDFTEYNESNHSFYHNTWEKGVASSHNFFGRIKMIMGGARRIAARLRDLSSHCINYSSIHSSLLFISQKEWEQQFTYDMHGHLLVIAK